MQSSSLVGYQFKLYLIFSKCPYPEDEANKKKVAALEKHAEAAVAAAAKASAATSSTGATTGSSYSVFKPPFATWKPGFIMPPLPAHNNDVNMA